MTTSPDNTRPFAGPPDTAASCDPAPLPVVEGYDLLAPVGRGGMGAVYEALQRATGARVAIKFMLAPPGNAESMRRRFEREVDLIARLQHPHIVRLLDSGVQRGQYYYVMEFVDGCTPLQAFPFRGAAPARGAVELMEKICHAVDFAHQHGVLHRDLKPSNILVDARSDPHLLDFGLAKSIDPRSGEWLDATLSESGQLLGTLGYMSPEQSRGERGGSVRGDVYSLGAIAYELFTGRLPCAVDGPLSQVLARIESVDPPRPSSVVPALRGDLDAILLKALAKEPQQRYATAGELAADLRRHRLREPIAARPASLGLRAQRWVQRNRAVALVGGLSVLALLALSTLSLLRIMRERDRAVASADLARTELRFALQAMEHVVFDTDQRLEGMVGVADVRQRVLDVALGFYDQLPQASAQLGLEELTAPQYGRLGDALLSRGDRSAADRLYRQSLAQLQTAGARDASAAARSRELQLAWQRIASIEPDAAAARAALSQAADIAALRCKVEPNPSAAYSDLADALMRIAECDRAANRSSELAPTIRRALDAHAAAEASAEPQSAERVTLERAHLLKRAVALLRDDGEPATLAEFCEQLLAIADALPTRFPESPEAHCESLYCSCRVADTWSQHGRADEARTVVAAARARADEALQRWPRDMTVRVASASVYSTLGNLAARGGRFAEAVERYRSARDLVGAAFELQPAESRYRRAYAAALNALGAAFALQEQWELAATEYEQFLRVSEPLAREESAHFAARAYAWHVVGDAYRKRPDAPAARRCYEAGLAELQQAQQSAVFDDYAADLRKGLSEALAELAATSRPTP